MLRFFSIFTLLTFTWMTIVQALLFPDSPTSQHCLTPRSYKAVIEYQSCLTFDANQPDDVHGLFRPIDEVDTKLSFDPLSRAESAYVSTQAELGSAANEKHKQGDTLSDYDRTVRRDERREN